MRGIKRRFVGSLMAACRTGLVLATTSLVLASSGCSFKASGVGEGDLSDIGKIPVCDNLTLEELVNARKLSDECKARLESFLPQPQDDFDSKLIVLGSEEQADGSLDVFVYGAHADGKALTTDDFVGAEVSVTVKGTANVLAEGDFTVTAVAEAPGDLLSMAMVNDYSGSMSDSDLKTVAQMETDIFTYLPPVYEASVTYFSTEVTQKLDFTSEQGPLLDAVAYDSAFERDLTALYDGMDTGLGGLVARPRPLKLLIVATDGQENNSTKATRAEVMSQISDSGVAVVMLGGLFSDPGDLKELAGKRGVYFYTPYYSDARAQIKNFLDALSNLTKINIPKDKRGDGPVTVDADGSHGEL